MAEPDRKEAIAPVPASHNGFSTAEHHAGVEKGHYATDVVPEEAINKNLSAKIKNPLAHFSRAALLDNVDEFVREKDLVEHNAVFRRGALVAQDPSSFEYISGEEALDDNEKTALINEVEHKWRVPKMLYMTIITCSIGAAVQGWDQEGSNGANLSFPAQFGIGTDSDYDTYIVGLINAAPYLGSCFIGCWLSDPLNYVLGRRGTIFFAAQFCFWPVLGSAFTQNWYQLLICRILLGIGMGAKASTVPVFAAENAPAAIRGALVMTWQLWVAFGIFLGVCANLIVGKAGDIAWRLQIGSAFIPALPLIFLIYLCPESPRWLMKKNRYKDAFASLLKLRNTPLQAARDIYYIHAQLQVESEVIAGRNYVTRFIDLFRVPRLRRATLASFVVMIGQQMCGINIIAFYSSTVFKRAGTSDYNALLASFGFGLINFLFAIPALYTIDTFGRRSLLLFTFPNMAWSLLAAGLCTLVPGEGGAHLGLVATFVYVFGAFYSPGEGPVPFVYAAEVFPLSHREVGMAWGVATNLFWASVLSITFPSILKSLDVIGAFCLYAGFNLVAFFMIFFWVPETKQRTLEELDYVFAVPTGVFIKYQTSVWLPWFIKRWVFFQKGAVLPPLYNFEQTYHDSEGERAFDGKEEHAIHSEKAEDAKIMQ